MTKTMKVCDWYGNIHPYEIKTTRAKHPIHMIEGGQYITEDMTETNPSSDMGVFGLNAKDYKWFKNHLQEVEIEIA
jgi:hypothetical protein